MALHRTTASTIKSMAATEIIVRGDIALVPLGEDDLPYTLAWRNCDAHRHWFKHAGEIPLEQHREWFQRYCRKDDDIVFVAVAAGSAQRIGQVSVYDIDFGRRTAEVGRFVVNPAYSGRGFMKTACLALLDVCWDRLGLDTVYLEVKKDNLRAVALYQKLGFHPQANDADYIKMSISCASPSPSLGSVHNSPIIATR